MFSEGNERRIASHQIGMAGTTHTGTAATVGHKLGGASLLAMNLCDSCHGKNICSSTYTDIHCTFIYSFWEWGIYSVHVGLVFVIA